MIFLMFALSIVFQIASLSIVPNQITCSLQYRQECYLQQNLRWLSFGDILQQEAGIPEGH
jgi:hypothetical protein